MSGNVRHYYRSSITWEDGPFSVGFLRADGCLCPDGERRTAYPSGTGTPDTFFSLPARVRVTRNGARYTVSGYVSTDRESVCETCGCTLDYINGWVHEDGSTEHVPVWSEREYVRFHPYLYGKNGYVLAHTQDLRNYVRRWDDYARARVRYYADTHAETADERYPYVREAQAELTRREADEA